MFEYFIIAQRTLFSEINVSKETFVRVKRPRVCRFVFSEVCTIAFFSGISLSKETFVRVKRPRECRFVFSEVCKIAHAAYESSLSSRNCFLFISSPAIVFLFRFPPPSPLRRLARIVQSWVRRILQQLGSPFCL